MKPRIVTSGRVVPGRAPLGRAQLQAFGSHARILDVIRQRAGGADAKVARDYQRRFLREMEQMDPSPLNPRLSREVGSIVAEVVAVLQIPAPVLVWGSETGTSAVYRRGSKQRRGDTTTVAKTLEDLFATIQKDRILSWGAQSKEELQQIMLETLRAAPGHTHLNQVCEAAKGPVIGLSPIYLAHVRRELQENPTQGKFLLAYTLAEELTHALQDRWFPASIERARNANIRASVLGDGEAYASDPIEQAARLFARAYVQHRLGTRPSPEDVELRFVSVFKAISRGAPDIYEVLMDRATDALNEALSDPLRSKDVWALVDPEGRDPPDPV